MGKLWQMFRFEAGKGMRKTPVAGVFGVLGKVGKHGKRELSGDEAAELESLADSPERLRRYGYTRSQSIGNEFGIHFDLWEWGGLPAELVEGDELPAWCVVAYSAMEKSCLIFAEGWPDLIGLLRDLSPIALAGLIVESNIDREAHWPVREVAPRKPG